MSESIKNHEATVMRMAADIIGHLLYRSYGAGGTMTHPPTEDNIVRAVRVARAIVAEVERTAPKEQS